ncbi:glycosyltransferase [Sphingobacterium sp. R2]|uniref:glycosyltransferase n=1 Tax=Sphingobacterium sp. R2 TaxID=3112958 RepID=UPI00345DB74D
MKKICFITPSLQKGGMERVISVLSNYLIDQGYEISIICVINGICSYTIDRRVKHIYPQFNYSRGILNKVKSFRFLYRTFKEENPDIVISFSEVFNPLSIAVSLLTGDKIIISDRSNPKLKHTLRDNLTRKLTYPLANGIIAQTELAKLIFLRKRYNKNIKVIPNPLKDIVNTVFKPSNKAIITVGRLVDSKNQKELIDLFYEIRNEEWKLYIVGGGKNEMKLKQQVRDLGLDNCVIFSGEVSDVESWMEKGSIFAYTSLSEGFPNALNEAMAYPLASIAYNCDAGVSDLIEDSKNGFLISMGEHDSYKEKLKLLMDNESLRLSFMEQGILNREKFKVETIAKTLTDFLSHTIGKK